MKTTRDYQDAITHALKNAGWVAMARMNTPEGVKFPLMNAKLGAVIIAMDDGANDSDSWKVCGSERDVLTWNNLVNDLMTTPVARAFVEHVEEHEDYSLSENSPTTIALDSWWWSDWGNAHLGS